MIALRLTAGLFVVLYGRQPAPSRSSNCPDRRAHRNAINPNEPSTSAQGMSQASAVMSLAPCQGETFAL